MLFLLNIIFVNLCDKMVVDNCRWLSNCRASWCSMMMMVAISDSGVGDKHKQQWRIVAA